jgi:hypothetical protein
VAIGDLTAFALEFNGTEDDCHDYDNTGSTNVGDLPIFGSAFAIQHFCP